MKKRPFAIFDREEAYTFRLVSFISEVAENIFDIRGFTDPEEFCRYCNEKAVEILLINEKNLMDLPGDLEYPGIILLREERENITPTSHPVISKYQSAEQIVQEILELFPSKADSEIPDALKSIHTEITGIYSPVNGCGKTSFALAATHLYGKRGSALYINLEDYSGLSTLLSMNSSNDISDLYYFYKQSHEKFASKLFSSVLSRYNIDMLPPIRYCRDLRNLQPEEWCEFIYQIIEASGFERVVLDISHMIGDAVPMLEMCSRIFVPTRRNELAGARMQEFEEYLTKIGKEEILLKMYRMEIPGGYFLQGKGHYIENLLLGPFSGYVKDMLEEAEENGQSNASETEGSGRTGFIQRGRFGRD